MVTPPQEPLILNGSCVVLVKAVPERKYTNWCGGSILSSLGSAQKVLKDRIIELPPYSYFF